VLLNSGMKSVQTTQLAARQSAKKEAARLDQTQGADSTRAQAMTQRLARNSASLALLEEEPHALRLAVAVNARSAGEVVQVEHALGFPVRGLQVPLTLENSLLVRALREARVFVTTDVSDMAGGALSDDIVCAIREIAGKRTFAVVPVLVLIENTAPFITSWFRSEALNVPVGDVAEPVNSRLALVE